MARTWWPATPAPTNDAHPISAQQLGVVTGRRLDPNIPDLGSTTDRGAP